ncbi:MAG: aminotransferase class V-fold PLP-dependent enzyme [Sphingorhabdus sp.]
MLETPRLYLDHAATTPVLPAVREAMMAAMEIWANPSSPHSDGRAAKAAVEDARARLGTALGWDGEIIFTSGASEAITMAMDCDAPFFASAVEHDAVLACIGTGDLLPVSADGLVDIDNITQAGRYAIQSVNSETGVIQPLDRVGEAIRAARGVWLADCSQSAGKMPLADADMIVISAHKLGGPPGVGALLLRELGLLKPTGGHEQGYRRGTENLPAIIGLSAAIEMSYEWMGEAAELRRLLDSAISAEGGEVVAEGSSRLDTISSYRMPGVSANGQLIAFDMAGISVSAGSACSSGTLKSSHVLKAMGWDDKAASEVIRVSFGPQTRKRDIERFMDLWRGIKQRATAA